MEAHCCCLSERLLSPFSPPSEGEDQESRGSIAQASGRPGEGRGIGPPESGVPPVVINLLSGQRRIRSERMKCWRRETPKEETRH